MDTDDERRQAARRKVQSLKGFYRHLMIYAAVNIGLLAINLITSPDTLWFYWPLLGWGIGLSFHALQVFRPVQLFGRDWEERKVREYMARDGRDSGPPGQA